MSAPVLAGTEDHALLSSANRIIIERKE